MFNLPPTNHLTRWAAKPPNTSILSYLVIGLPPLPSPRSASTSVSHCQRSVQRIQAGMPNVHQATLNSSWSSAVTTQNAELLLKIPTESSFRVGGRWTGYMYTWPPTRRVWSGSEILRGSVTTWLRLCTKAPVSNFSIYHLSQTVRRWSHTNGFLSDWTVNNLMSHRISMLTNVYMIETPRLRSIQNQPEHL